MASGTYTEGGVDCISRVRRESADLPDSSGTVQIGDSELQRWLDDSLSDERILIYLPTGHGGATGATVEIKLAPPTEPYTTQTLQLVLTRTGLGAADTLTFQPSRSYQRIESVIRWIIALEKGWQVGFQIGPDREWAALSRDFVAGLYTTGRLSRFAPSINLAPTEGAVTAYGENVAELRFYRVWSVIQKAHQQAQEGKAGGVGGVIKSWTDGNRSITYQDSRESYIAHMAGRGIYAA